MRNTFIAAVIFVTLALQGQSARATTIFEDDFSSDRGWVGNDPQELFIDAAAGVARFTAHRDEYQYLSIPIVEITGDVRIEIVSRFDTHAFQPDVFIGISAGSPPPVGWPGPGFYLHPGYYAGAFRTGAYIVDAAGQTTSLTDGGPPDDGRYDSVDVTGNAWYRSVLTIQGNRATLEIYDANTGADMGGLFADISTSLAPFRFATIENSRLGDPSVGSGAVDYIRVDASTPVPEPGFLSLAAAAAAFGGWRRARRCMRGVQQRPLQG